MLYSAGFFNKRKSVQRFLKKMTVKEGLRMDTRESCAQIRPFIKIHGLDPTELLLPCMRAGLAHAQLAAVLIVPCFPLYPPSRSG